MVKGRNSRVIAVRVGDDVYAKAEEVAKAKGITVGEWVKGLISVNAMIRTDGSVNKGSNILDAEATKLYLGNRKEK